nr:hypothetical protein [Chlamydiota bacterium]
MGKVGRLIFIAIILTTMNIFAKNDKPNNYVKHAQKLLNGFADKIEKEYGLSCIGTGGGMPYDIEKFSLDFVSYNRGSIEDARELVVKI